MIMMQPMFAFQGLFKVIFVSFRLFHDFDVQLLNTKQIANESYLKTIYDNGKYETVARRRMTIRIAEKQSVSAARDERGDTQHTHSSWRRENELVFDECETIPFMINDNTGVPINVVFASIHELPLKRVWMHFKPNDSKDVNLNLNVGVPMVGDVGSRTIGTQDEEWILPLDKVCLVIGEARLNLDGTMSIGSPRLFSRFEK